MVLEVRDNGCGFSEEFLVHFEEYKKSLDEQNVNHILEKMSIGGLCLPNIYIRLKILYEKTYVFELYNEQDGAVVLLGGLMDAEDIDSGR